MARLVRDVLPNPIRDHFVVIGSRRFPPKQVVALLTGADRADFTTHHARRLLQRAGFATGRRSRSDDIDDLGPGRIEEEAARLAPHRRRWVALRGARILVATDRPEDAVAWLTRHDEHVDALFRVPADDASLEAARWR